MHERNAFKGKNGPLCEEGIFGTYVYEKYQKKQNDATQLLTELEHCEIVQREVKLPSILGIFLYEKY